VPTLFRDHLVLQRGRPDPVWGTAAAGAAVTVSFAGRSVSTTADGGGAWRVDLPPLPATRKPLVMTIASGTRRITIRDVQVGEVWVCSGQSNMELPLRASIGGAAAAAGAPQHDIRLFMAAWTTIPARTAWTLPTPAAASAFSAACFYFGRELAQRLGVPIGLIQSTKSGTYIAEWTHATGGTCSGIELTRRGPPPVVAGLYEAKIAPLIPYGIRGVTWYQGENDSRDCGAVYYRKLRGLIGEWRAAWGQGAFPFGVVQLPFTRTPVTMMAQLLAAETIPGVFLAVTADLPILGGTELHPANKEPVDLRLAIGARAVAYGDDVPAGGPVPDRDATTVVGSTVRVAFRQVGLGLVTGSSWQPAGAPGPFYIAGPSGGFHLAQARIVGDEVVLRSPSVAIPLKVRYVWTKARGNLYSRVRIAIAGGRATYTRLPASPFELVVGTTDLGPPPVHA